LLAEPCSRDARLGHWASTFVKKLLLTYSERFLRIASPGPELGHTHTHPQPSPLTWIYVRACFFALLTGLVVLFLLLLLCKRANKPFPPCSEISSPLCHIEPEQVNLPNVRLANFPKPAKATRLDIDTTAFSLQGKKVSTSSILFRRVSELD
jgi:hypothetical protein